MDCMCACVAEHAPEGLAVACEVQWHKLRKAAEMYLLHVSTCASKDLDVSASKHLCGTGRSRTQMAARFGCTPLAPQRRAAAERTPRSRAPGPNRAALAA
eukprot:scaffold91659_cov36-Tisochrysis_lutea.AAC.2